MSDIKVEFRQMSQAERRKTLAPGERAVGVLPNGQALVTLGVVPNDGSTRQQRRAAARGKG